MRCVVWLLAAVLAACQFDPYGSQYTQARPVESALVGTYVPTPETLAMVREKGKYPPAHSSVVLQANGGLTFTNIPDWWLDGFGKPNGGFYSGEGTWHLDNAHGYWVLLLDVASTSGFSSQDPLARGFGTEIALINDKPPYVLHFIVGDPDMGDAMQFSLGESTPPANQRLERP